MAAAPVGQAERLEPVGLDAVAGGTPARPRHTARWAAACVAVVVLLFIGVLATRPPASTRVAGTPLLGRPAPEIEGPALDGSTVRLSDFAGRYVLVNFFATWCDPCRKEHPDLVRFSRTHAADVAVLSVIYDRDDRRSIEEFFATHGGDWPVVDDPGSNVDFGVRGVPESFLVAPDGTVLLRIVGGVEADKLDALLRKVKGSFE